MTVVHVDFKAKKASPAPEVEQWDATKDPEFQAYVEGLAQAAELMKARGGDWRKCISIMHDRGAIVEGTDVGTMIRLTHEDWISGEAVKEALAICIVQLDPSVLEEGDDEQPANDPS